MLLTMAATTLAGCDQFVVDSVRSRVFRIVEVKIEQDPKAKAERRLASSQGTGFHVHGKNLLATNLHVVRNWDGGTYKAVVLVPNGGGGLDIYDAKVVGKDAERDLALLETERVLPGAEPLRLADYLPLRQSAVTAVGYPGTADKLFGTTRSLMRTWINNQTATTTPGIVSHHHSGRGVTLIQHSAMVSAGNSGGPLFDGCGNVVGINTVSAQEGVYGSVSSTDLIRLLGQIGRSPSTAQSCNWHNTDRFMPYVVALTALLLAAVSIVLMFRRTGRRQAYTLMTRAADLGRGGAAPLDLTVSPPGARHLPSGPGTRAAAVGDYGPTRSSREDAAGGKLRLIPTAGGNPITIGIDRIASSTGVSIGRGGDCEVVIGEPTVSKRHARIAKGADGRIVLEDLGSGNGTWRGRTRITRETLASGDVIRFGTTEFQVQLPQIAGSPAMAQPRGTAIDQPIAAAVSAGGGVAQAAYDGGAGLRVRAAATGQRAWVLSGLDDQGKVVQFPLRPTADGVETFWTIGRRSQQADLVVPHQSVSSRHARLRYRPGIGGLEICDLGSTNGTLVDGKRIGQDYVPLDGARKIVLGEFEMNVGRS
jgi:pSer/pThr/pTyr-binding forkhead associated (FHA) protein